jgi:pilus assembly protein CpaF
MMTVLLVNAVLPAVLEEFLFRYIPINLLSDGSRKVDAVTEVTGLEGSQVVMQDLFRFTQTGVDAHGRIQGVFGPTGAVPTWFDQLAGRGIDLDPRMFDPDCRDDVTVF